MGRQDYETETLVTHGFTNRGYHAEDSLETLRAGCHGALPMIAHSLRADGFDASEDDTGRGTPLIAFSQNQMGDVLSGDVMHALGTNQNATGRNAVNVQRGMAVRRLTPRECERLQGFPDDYTKISDKTADGPRYKALGNSMAVPVMAWLGARIDAVDKVTA